MATVRQLSIPDRPEWFRLRHELWPDCPREMHECEMAEILACPEKHTAFVYSIDDGAGRLGGFIEASIRDRVDGAVSSAVGYVEGWYVEKDLRGRGIGRSLLAAAEDWARQRGLIEMGSDCEIDNPAALATHKALGFKETFRLIHLLKPLAPNL